MFLKKHYYWFAIIFLIGILLPGTALAADAAQQGETIQKTMTSIVAVVQIGLSFLEVFLWPLLWLSGKLMTNDLIFGNGVENTLRTIWQEIRNIVNLCFVIILMVTAFANILSILPENKYKLKTMMPKFVVAVILVNFSFFGIKVILDTTNILTTALIGISGQKIEGFAKWPAAIDSTTKYYLTDQKSSDSDKDPKALSAALKGNAAMRGKFEAETCNSIKDKKKGDSDTYGRDLVCEVNSTTNKFTGYMSKATSDFLHEVAPRNITLYLATNLMQINRVNQLSKSLQTATTDSTSTTVNSLTYLLSTISKLAIGTVISIVLLFVFGTAVIALVILLFVRVILMWNLLVLSPLLAIVPFIPDSVKSGASELLPKAIKHAIAPVILAATMGIGITILYGLQDADFAGDFSSISTASDVMQNLTDIAIYIGAVTVVWVGVKQASDGTIAAKAIGFVQSTVQSVGEFAGKSATIWNPMLAVSVPGHPNEKLNLASLSEGIKELPGMVTSQSSKAKEDWKKEFFNKNIADSLGLPKIKDTFEELLYNLEEHNRKGLPSPTSDETHQVLRKTVGVSSDEALKGDKFRADLAETLRKTGFDAKAAEEITAKNADGKYKITNMKEWLDKADPSLKEKLFGAHDVTVDDMRRDYNAETDTTPATTSTMTPTQSARGLVSQGAADGTKVADVKPKIAAAAKKDPQDKEAQALAKMDDTHLQKLLDLKKGEMVDEILTQAKKGDGFDTKLIDDLAEAAKAIQANNTITLKKLIDNKKITVNEAKTLIGLSDIRDKTALEAVVNPPGAPVVPTPGAPVTPSVPNPGTPSGSGGPPTPPAPSAGTGGTTPTPPPPGP